MTKLGFERRRELLIGAGSDSRWLLGSMLLPTALLVSCVLALAWFLRRLLVEAEVRELEITTLVPLCLALCGMGLVAAILVLSQARRSARRLEGPQQRLIVGMQRTRSGDIGFRVHLRRGDALRELATEYNKLLDWLNANPPQGVQTGSDVVEVDPGERMHALSIDEPHPDDEAEQDDVVSMGARDRDPLG